MLKIVGGALKGRRLKTYKGNVIRPTSEKIREAIFDILTSFFPEGAVLDLFAGTGSMGIEALSRGMRKAVFVEDNPRIISLLRKNISACQIEDRVELITLSVTKGLKLLQSRDDKFRIIFLDPPYEGNWVGRTLLNISDAHIVTNDGIVIAEHSSKEMVKSSYGNLVLDDRRKYGQTEVSFFICS